MIVRRATSGDGLELLDLYTALTSGSALADASAIDRVLEHPGTDIWVCAAHNQLVAMCTLHILPNVTNNARPYALIENVATRPTEQKRGFGRAVMQGAIDAAWQAGAYKIMLMTGRSNNAKGFYEALGFDSTEKWPMVLRRP